jgi:hypothetical protein
MSRPTKTLQGLQEMIIDEHQTPPTDAECDAYFDALPALKNKHSVNKLKARAVSYSAASDQPVNVDSQAEINTTLPAVIAFADNVSSKNRDAVMLSIAFAEAVANDKSDIDKDTIDYLQEYAGALSIAGWTMSSSNYGLVQTSNQSITMDALVLEILSSIAGPNAAAVIQLMTSVLDNLQNNDPLIKLFESNAKKSKKTSFRLVPCLQSPAGTPVTYLLAMDIESSTANGGVLFWKWKVSNLTIKRLAKGLEFSRSRFDRYEDRILRYLDDNADAFFESLAR